MLNEYLPTFINTFLNEKRMFLELKFYSYYFFTFNISDVYIVLILMIHHETKTFSLPLIVQNQLLHFKTYNVGYAEIV